MQPLDDLLHHLRSLKDPFVVGHENADPDAVAAAYALSLFLSTGFGFPESVSRAGRKLLNYLDVSYEINPKIEGKDLVVVDTSSREMLGSLPLEEAHSITVVDHHSLPPTIGGRLFVYPEMSSTSEIVLRLFERAGAPLDEKTRNALLIGVIWDSRGLSLASPETLKIVAKYIDRPPVELISIIGGEEDVTERIAKLKALRKGEIYRMGDVLVAVAETGSFESSVANMLVSAGADVSVAFSEERVIIRISQRGLKMGITSEVLFRGLDALNISCGGHEAAAGCKAMENPRLVVDRVLENVENFLRNKGYSFVLRRY